MLSPFLLALLVDVVTEFSRALSKLLYADDVVQMSEKIDGLMDKLFRWKEDF